MVENLYKLYQALVKDYVFQPLTGVFYEDKDIRISDTEFLNIDYIEYLNGGGVCF